MILNPQSLNTHDQHNYRILSRIDSEKRITQRSIAGELGIALGLTNLLIKRLVKKGYVKTGKAIKGKRIRYLLTPQGIAEKTRLSIGYLENTIRLYTETKDKIRRSLLNLAGLTGEENRRQRVVFYGAGEVAEIAYIALDRSLFELVGVVDDRKQGQQFFDLVVGSPEELSWDGAGCPDLVVVTTFRKSQQIDNRLENLKIPSEQIVFL